MDGLRLRIPGLSGHRERDDLDGDAVAQSMVGALGADPHLGGTTAFHQEGRAGEVATVVVQIKFQDKFVVVAIALFGLWRLASKRC